MANNGTLSIDEIVRRTCILRKTEDRLVPKKGSNEEAYQPLRVFKHKVRVVKMELFEHFMRHYDNPNTTKAALGRSIIAAANKHKCRKQVMGNVQTVVDGMMRYLESSRERGVNAVNRNITNRINNYNSANNVNYNNYMRNYRNRKGNNNNSTMGNAPTPTSALSGSRGSRGSTRSSRSKPKYTFRFTNDQIAAENKRNRNIKNLNSRINKLEKERNMLSNYKLGKLKGYKGGLEAVSNRQNKVTANIKNLKKQRNELKKKM